MNQKLKPGILVIESPQSPSGFVEFGGFLMGAEVTADTLLNSSNKDGGKDRGYGEVVFNTSMTGYQEILTDPSYYGQMVCMTVPHVGNTGVNSVDRESLSPYCAGFIMQQACDEPSNWRSEGSLDAFLKKNGIPAIVEVDTRALTRLLRMTGVMRGLILPLEQKSSAAELLKRLPKFEGRDLIREVTTRKAYSWPTPESQISNEGYNPAKLISKKGSKKFKVVAVDFGIKWNLLRSLEQMGCDVEVVPADTSAADILAKKPSGVFLSNGPGDPTAAPYAVKSVREILGKVPIFGVCMGHQILSLALGAQTYKLKFGHRGGNQPVQDQETKKVEISSHNHGYAVDPKTLPAHAKVSHINLNDQCCEGISIPSMKAFSVQYHPEACPGPHDSDHLFGRFVKMME